MTIVAGTGLDPAPSWSWTFSRVRRWISRRCTCRTLRLENTAGCSRTPDGTFAFEKQRDKPVRFYGVNLCFSAHYITHEQADQLAERLVRLGYNTVRFHHYEGELVADQPDSTQLNPEKLDQLDYLFAALTKRGIYVTTDLYVSRPVSIAAILPDYAAGRRDAMNAFKVLAVNNEKAFENWKAFARNLLTHVNPYTKRAYKDDPGLAWLSLINEGNLGNYLNLAKEIPDYQRAWNRWLVERYRDRAGLAAAWGTMLRDGEDPGQGKVRLDGDIYNQDLRMRDVICFLDPSGTRLLRAGHEIPARRAGCQGAGDEHERVDQSCGESIGACGDGLCG